MDCCGLGHTFASQPWIWGTPLASVGAMLAGEVEPRGSTEAARTAETTAAALAVLRNSISIDVHSHGGTTGIASKAPPSSDLAIGAGRHERSADRLNYRNGYRERSLDTRLGSLQLRIPKLRQGSYFPPFLEPRKTAEKGRAGRSARACLGHTVRC